MEKNLGLEVKQMLSQMTGLDVPEIGDTDDLFNDLGIDSLKVIEIATQIERMYKIVVKESDLMKLRTVKEAVAYLKEVLENKNEQ